MIEHFKFLQAHTKQTPKMTIPSPSSLHFRYGRDAVPESIYPSMDDFYRDLGHSYSKVVRAFADAGCRYLQLDEVNLTYLCDPSLRKMIIDRGDDPDTLPATYARMINAAICRHSARHDDHHASVPRQFPLELRGVGRLRAGGGDSIQRDQCSRLFHGIRLPRAPAASSRCASCRRARSIVLGLVTSKSGTLEKKDDIKRRIDEAAKFVDARSAVPVAAMRLCFDRGGQCLGRGARNGRNCG